MAPAYLAADCQLVSDVGRRQLRSADSRTCVVRRPTATSETDAISLLLARSCGTAFQLVVGK